MWARISAFVIWSLVAAAGAFWLLRLTTSAPQAPGYASAVGKSTVVRGDLNRLFGAAPSVVAAAEAIPQAPSRFKLVGVMAPRSKEAQSVAGSGLALIAVDGKPAKAFTVGAPLESGLVLQSVGLRTASIGPAQGTRSVLLELPALAAPNTGVLPSSAGAVSPPAFVGSPVPPNSGVLPQLGQPTPPARGAATMRAPPSAVLPTPSSTSQAPPPQMPMTPPPGPSPSATMNSNDSTRSQ
jgi:general secretion pathway protein C